MDHTKAIELAVQAVLGSGFLITLARYVADLRHERDARERERERERDARERERELRIRESKKPFHQRRLELYFEACDVASKLATMDDSEEREQCRQHFWQLFWGQLCLVESEEVANAMIAFGNELGSGSRPTLQDKAFALASCCRASIATTWEEDLPPLRPLTVVSVEPAAPDGG